MSVYLCGNSHLGALAKGLRELQSQGTAKDLDIVIAPFGTGAVEVEPFSEATDGGVRLIAEEYRQNLVKRCGSEVMSPDHLWGLCVGTHNSRLYRNALWRRSRPNHLAGERDQPISEGLLAAMIEADQRHVKAFFLQLQQAGVPFFLISAPHPKKGHEKTVERAGLDTMLHIDAEARNSMTSWAAANDIDIITPPEESVGEDGFLRDEFEQKISPAGRLDAHHANEKYGILMMQKVIAYLGTRKS